MNHTNTSLLFDVSRAKGSDPSDFTQCDLETKSILKPPKVRAPLQEVDLGLDNHIDHDIIRRRRVSFAGVNRIKEFNSKAESLIICSTPAYEETFSTSSDSSALTSSIIGSRSVGDDCTIMDDTMDLTAIEIEDYPKTSIEITSLVKLTDVHKATPQNICNHNRGITSPEYSCSPENKNAYINAGALGLPTSKDVCPQNMLVHELLDHSDIVEDISVMNLELPHIHAVQNELKNVRINGARTLDHDASRISCAGSQLAESECVPPQKDLSMCSNNKINFHSIKSVNSKIWRQECDISGMELTGVLPSNCLVPVSECELDPVSCQSLSSMEFTEAVRYDLRMGNQNGSIEPNKEVVGFLEGASLTIHQNSNPSQHSNYVQMTSKGLEVTNNDQLTNHVAHVTSLLDSSRTMDFTEVLNPQQLRTATVQNKENVPDVIFKNHNVRSTNILFHKSQLQNKLYNDESSSMMDFTEALVLPIKKENVGNCDITFKEDPMFPITTSSMTNINESVDCRDNKVYLMNQKGILVQNKTLDQRNPDNLYVANSSLEHSHSMDFTEFVPVKGPFSFTRNLKNVDSATEEKELSPRKSSFDYPRHNPPVMKDVSHSFYTTQMDLTEGIPVPVPVDHLNRSLMAHQTPQPPTQLSFKEKPAQCETVAEKSMDQFSNMSQMEITEAIPNDLIKNQANPLVPYERLPHLQPSQGITGLRQPNVIFQKKFTTPLYDKENNLSEIPANFFSERHNIYRPISNDLSYPDSHSMMEFTEAIPHQAKLPSLPLNRTNNDHFPGTCQELLSSSRNGMNVSGNVSCVEMEEVTAPKNKSNEEISKNEGFSERHEGRELPPEEVHSPSKPASMVHPDSPITLKSPSDHAPKQIVTGGLTNDSKIDIFFEKNSIIRRNSSEKTRETHCFQENALDQNEIASCSLQNDKIASKCSLITSLVEFTDMLPVSKQNNNILNLQKQLNFSVDREHNYRECSGSELCKEEIFGSEKRFEVMGFTGINPKKDTSSLEENIPLAEIPQYTHVSVHCENMEANSNCGLPRITNSSHLIYSSRPEADNDEKETKTRTNSHIEEKPTYENPKERGESIGNRSDTTPLELKDHININREEVDMSVDESEEIETDSRQNINLENNLIKTPTKFTESQNQSFNILLSKNKFSQIEQTVIKDNKIHLLPEESNKHDYDSQTLSSRNYLSTANFQVLNRRGSSSEKGNSRAIDTTDAWQRWHIIKTNRTFMNGISFTFVGPTRWKRSLPWPVDVILQIPFTEVNSSSLQKNISLCKRIHKYDSLGLVTDMCLMKNLSLYLSEDWLNSQCKTIKDLLVVIKLIEEEYKSLKPLLSSLKYVMLRSPWSLKDKRVVFSIVDMKKRMHILVKVNVLNYKNISGRDIEIVIPLGQVSFRQKEVQQLFDEIKPSKERFWLFICALDNFLTRKSCL